MTIDLIKYRKLAVIALLVAGLDQITKHIVLSSMDLYHSVPVIPGFFNLTHIHNPGGAFGFFANQSQEIRSFVFIFVSFLALGFILYFYKNTPASHKMLASGFALIFGGAVGNMIDRIRFGTVVDFPGCLHQEYALAGIQYCRQCNLDRNGDFYLSCSGQKNAAGRIDSYIYA